MHWIKQIIISFLFLEYTFDLWLEIRQYRNIKYQTKELPEYQELEKLKKETFEQRKKEQQQKESEESENTEQSKSSQDESQESNDEKDTFEKSKEYALAKIQFGFVSSGFDVVKDFFYLTSGIIPMAWFFVSDSIVAPYIYSGNDPQSRYQDIWFEIIVSIVFTFLSSIFEQIIGLPFSIYHTFVLEESFGFNKTTAYTFVTDRLKSLLINFAITSPILSIIIYVLKTFSSGQFTFLYIWLALFAFQLFLMTIYEDYIAPLFNTYTNLEDGELKQLIENLSSKLNFPLSDIFVIDGSRRSSHSNAYQSGIFAKKRIVLFDTLFTQMNNNQICSVVCHELGHWAYSHIWKSLLITQVEHFTMWYLVGLFIHSSEFYEALGFPDDFHPVIIGLLVFFSLYSPISTVLGFAMNFLSRKFEYEADEYAYYQGYSQELKQGLVLLHEKNLGDYIPDKLYSLLHYSHPTLVERLSAISQLEKKKQ